MVESGADHPSGDLDPATVAVPGPRDVGLERIEGGGPGVPVRGLDLAGDLRASERPEQADRLHRAEYVISTGLRGAAALAALLGGDLLAALLGNARLFPEAGRDPLLHRAVDGKLPSELLPRQRVAALPEQCPHAVLVDREAGQPFALGQAPDPSARRVPGLQVVAGEVLTGLPAGVVARDLAHKVAPARRADAFRAHGHAHESRARRGGSSAFGRSPIAKGVKVVDGPRGSGIHGGVRGCGVSVWSVLSW